MKNVGTIAWKKVDDKKHREALMMLIQLEKHYKIKGSETNRNGNYYGKEYYHYYVEYSGLQLMINSKKKYENIDTFTVWAKECLKTIGIDTKTTVEFLPM
jgi:hypothetical protein